MPEETRLDLIRQRRPLLHCVSNIVSANDCANLALAIGASPMMAQAAEEMEEITHLSAATVLNTGTPDRERFRVCGICGRTANEIGQPVILDPVGVGASSWRLEQVRALLSEVRPTVLRVNLGEAEALCRQKSREQGVDSVAGADRELRLALARELSERYETAVLLTGEEDLILDEHEVFCVSGGSRLSTRVTGTGCMLSVLCGAFSAVEPEAAKAAALAAAFWKLCAETAERNTAGRGSGTYRTELINAAGLLNSADLALRGNIRELNI